MKYIVKSISTVTYRGNKGYRFTLENLESKEEQYQILEPRNARALRDNLELATIEDLVGMTLELNEAKK